MAEERLGFVGIVSRGSRRPCPQVNEILSSFAAMIEGRMGVPSPSRGQSVICLIVRGTNDQLGAMTGKMGNLPGVQVKSALVQSKPNPTNETD